MEQRSNCESIFVARHERKCIRIRAQERRLDTGIVYRRQNLDGYVSVVEVQCSLAKLEVEPVSRSPHEFPRIAEAYALRQLEKCVLRAWTLEIDKANELTPSRVSYLGLG